MHSPIYYIIIIISIFKTYLQVSKLFNIAQEQLSFSKCMHMSICICMCLDDNGNIFQVLSFFFFVIVYLLLMGGQAGEGQKETGIGNPKRDLC